MLFSCYSPLVIVHVLRAVDEDGKPIGTVCKVVSNGFFLLGSQVHATRSAALKLAHIAVWTSPSQFGAGVAHAWGSWNASRALQPPPGDHVFLANALPTCTLVDLTSGGVLAPADLARGRQAMVAPGQNVPPDTADVLGYSER